MSSTTRSREVIGESARRVDGVPKVTGDFAFGSDLRADNMLWGVTVRSPHASAKILSIDLVGRGAGAPASPPSSPPPTSPA